MICPDCGTGYLIEAEKALDLEARRIGLFPALICPNCHWWSWTPRARSLMERMGILLQRPEMESHGGDD